MRMIVLLSNLCLLPFAGLLFASAKNNALLYLGFFVAILALSNMRMVSKATRPHRFFDTIEHASTGGGNLIFLLCLVMMARQTIQNNKSIYFEIILAIPALAGLIYTYKCRFFSKQPSSNIPEPSACSSYFEYKLHAATLLLFLCVILFIEDSLFHVPMNGTIVIYTIYAFATAAILVVLVPAVIRLVRTK